MQVLPSTLEVNWGNGHGEALGSGLPALVGVRLQAQPWVLDSGLGSAAEWAKF